MKKLFGYTPIVADRDDLSDSSEPKTQLQNVQRAGLHITPIVTPTPTPPPVNPAPLSQAAGPPEGRGAASVAAPGVPQSSLVQHADGFVRLPDLAHATRPAGNLVHDAVEPPARVRGATDPGNH